MSHNTSCAYTPIGSKHFRSRTFSFFLRLVFLESVGWSHYLFWNVGGGGGGGGILRSTLVAVSQLAEGGGGLAIQTEGGGGLAIQTEGGGGLAIQTEGGGSLAIRTEGGGCLAIQTTATQATQCRQQTDLWEGLWQPAGPG